MKIQIVSISFANIAHDHAASALSVRKNAFQAYSFPEWQQGINKSADDCPLLYSMTGVNAHAQQVAVKVRFSVSGLLGAASTISVKAVQPVINGGGSYLELLLNTQVNVLGEIGEQSFQILADGQTADIIFFLKNQRITSWGIGIYRVIWKWQFRAGRFSGWETFEVTEHKVYTILQAPTAPWTDDPQEDLLWPWTDVLDHACTWAAKANTEDEAAALITGKIYGMGPQWFEYNCVNFMPAYIQVKDFFGNSYFNCMAFLQHLAYRNVNRFLICSDCATIVSTFANILGCDLWQSTLQTQGIAFRVNGILPIGESHWQTPCGFPGFAYHEVAWKGNCTSSDPVYDACLCIDGSDNPVDSLRWPLLPVKMLPGSRGSGLYRDKLVLSADWQIAEPRPQTRVRRLPVPVKEGVPAHVVSASEKKVSPAAQEPLKKAKARFGFDSWCNRNGLAETLFIHQFQLDVSAFPDWEIQVLAEVPAKSSAPGFLNTVWRITDSSKSTVKADFYECPSRLSAQEFALQLLTASHIGTGVLNRVEGIGDVAFKSAGNDNILFTRANMVVMIATADRSGMPVFELASLIDKYIYQKPADAPGPDQQKELSVADPSQKTLVKGARVLISNHMYNPPVSAGQKLSTPKKRSFTKVFSGTGDLMSENGECIYKVQRPGNQKISVYKS